MVKQFLANFTWVDFCLAAIIIRGCWIGFRKGLLTETFKVIALVVAVFIGLHFYVRCGDFFVNFLKIPQTVAYIFSYVLLIGGTIGFFRIARDALFIFLSDKEEGPSFALRAVSLILGFGRGLVLSSLVVIGCLMIDVGSLTRTVRHSFVMPGVLSLAPKIYAGTFRYGINPVFPNEQGNLKMLALVESPKRVFE